MAAAIPMILKEIKDFFSGPVKPEDRLAELRAKVLPKQEDPVTKQKHTRPGPRKVRDMTPWTQAHYDRTMDVYKKCMQRNVDEGRLVMKQVDIARKLNLIMNLNKSVTAYRELWSGKIPRETLPESDEEYPYED